MRYSSRLWVTNWVAGMLIALALPAVAGAEGAELKVTRVVVFSSGVAYFECEATVTDAADAELRFRTEQINDILKSLVVQDLDGGKVSSIGYSSRDPVEKTLKSFGVDVTGNPGLGGLLQQLRGEPVEIAAPRAMKGTILGVETHTVKEDKAERQVEFLNLVTDEGLQQLRLQEVQGISLTNEKVALELKKALAALASSHDADKRSVLIRFEGKGQRRVQAGYLLEAPIWKTSYRLVLSGDETPFIQGWATVENATEADWKDVRLSLVSGRPISFRMDLYTPLYVPRPLEELELYASLRPPEYAGGMTSGGILKRREAPANKAARRAAPPASVPPPSPPRGGVLVDERNDWGYFFAGEGRGVASAAKAQQAGELFEYAIATPVSIARQRSAMLPIVNQNIAGIKVSIFNPATHPKHPLNGLQIENTTGLNLMQGPVTIFDGNTYAGDAKLPDLRPGEKRLIGYALDLAVEVMTAQQQPVENVSTRIAKGTLYHRHRYVDERTYTAKNKDGKERTLLIEQAYGDDWKLIAPEEPFERAPGLSRFKVAVPAGKTAEEKIRLERVADEAIVLSECGLDQIQHRLSSLGAEVMSAEVKAALEKVVAMRMELDRTARELAAQEKAVNEAVQEQGRIRENLKTLQQNSDTYQRQLKKFDAIETNIEELRGKIAQLRQQHADQRARLEAYLLSLDIG